MAGTVLVVDDDRNIHGFFRAMLEPEGLAVLCEADAQWALRIFEKREVDFVVLGNLGRQPDEFELAKRIRRSPRGAEVPLLMIGGQGCRADVLEAARGKYKLVDFLQKPLEPARVFEALRTRFELEMPSVIARDGAALPARTKAHGKTRAPSGLSGPEDAEEKAEVEREAREFGAASWKGALEETPFAEVLARLYRERATGALLVRHERLKKLVFFREGYPTVIRSNRLQECLGQMMVRAKVITEAELAASLEKMKTTRRQQGTVLVELGCVSPHSLKLMLDLQLQLKLYDLFGWERGAFKFKADVEVPASPVALEASTAALIHKGVQKKLKLERLSQLLEADLERYPAPSPEPLMRFQDMDLAEEDEARAAGLRGERRLREVFAAAAPEELERIHQLVYALKASGMLVFLDAPRRAPMLSAPPPPEDDPGRRPTQVRLPPPPLACLPEEPVPDLSEEETAEAAQAPAPPAARGSRRTGLTQVRKAIAEKIEDLASKDYFQVLGVARDATRDAITRAFLLLARRHHPDRASNTDSTQVRTLSGDLFRLICQAYETLSDDRRRAEYLDRLRDQRETPSQVAARRSLDAEAAFKEGERAYKRREWSAAREAFERAVGLCPNEGEYHCYLGMAMFQERPTHKPSLEQAREELNRAIGLSPTYDLPHLHLAYVYRALGHRQLAVGEFEAAAQCNPDCVDALRELRLLRLRQKAQKKKPGLFGKK